MAHSFANRVGRLVVVILPLALSACATAGGEPFSFLGPRDAPARAGSADYASFESALANAKKSFRAADFGNAESAYRVATVRNPASGEAWLGLAASYDRLKRFDLADRAYAQALDRIGERPEYYNNIGYSHLLRGDLVTARKDFQRAQQLDPENPVVRNNLEMLRQSVGLDSAQG
jgi:Flp pilus assembly protein TadD